MYNIQELVDARVKLIQETFKDGVVFDEKCASYMMVELAGNMLHGPKAGLTGTMLSMIVLAKAGLDISVFVPCLQRMEDEIEAMDKVSAQHNKPHNRN